MMQTAKEQHDAAVRARWDATVAKLPKELTWALRITIAEYNPNELTALHCLQCQRLWPPCEWDVHLPGDGNRKTAGLHETCRMALLRRGPV